MIKDTKAKLYYFISTPTFSCRRIAMEQKGLQMKATRTGSERLANIAEEFSAKAEVSGSSWLCNEAIFQLHAYRSPFPFSRLQSG